MPTLAQKYENNKQDINALTAVDLQLGSSFYPSSVPPLAQTSASNIAKRSELSKLIAIFAPAQGRLTLESGVPYPTSNQVDKGTLYWTPYKGNNIALHDGTRWRLRQFTEQKFDLTVSGLCTTVNGSNIVTTIFTPPPADPFGTFALIIGMKISGTGIPANTTITNITSGNTFTMNNNATASGDVTLTFKVVGSALYDVCGVDVPTGYVDSGYGELLLTLVKWTDGSNRANALTTLNGVPCLTDAVNYAGTSLAGSRFRYLGTIGTVSDGLCNDSYSYRYVWNMYNRLRRVGFTYNTNNSWTYGTGAWRECNGGSGQVRFNFVIGEASEVRASMNAWTSTPAGGGYHGAGIDGVTSNHGWSMLSYGGILSQGYHAERIRSLLTAGYHYGTQIEWCNATGTYYGYGSATNNGYGGAMFTLEM